MTTDAAGRPVGAGAGVDGSAGDGPEAAGTAAGGTGLDGPAPDGTVPDGTAPDDTASATTAPRILAHTAALTASASDPDERGAVWRLAEPTRHLDANVIAVPPHASIDPHAGPSEDVLWHVIAGSGTLATDDGDVALSPGAIVWLPRGSKRAVIAGDAGLRYLSVHRRKSGLQIGSRPA
ncbi:cupin domain-containing protein [Agrococcus sp. ARC_14]|uniref:cupin domain-containing protein n=1 Tax=Agrococcus sp. ARC_14 TaxID=2919927 RepID=UPI001F063A34|nr:cupin domain-containing protein [Agrococcus sp. ARC_14]MCH1884013.1 cupin domain-containing protein [Agrococcus sp. ARC_14]